MRKADEALQQLEENPLGNSAIEADTRLSSGEAAHLREIEELRKAKITNAKLREDIENLRQDREQRKQFAERIFFSVKSYMVCIIFLLFVQGFHILYFSLSDTVLVTLLGTTTINVIGIFAFVARYLFHRHKQ